MFKKHGPKRGVSEIVSVRLRPDTVRLLEVKAEESRRTLSNYIEVIVAKYTYKELEKTLQEEGA